MWSKSWSCWKVSGRLVFQLNFDEKISSLSADSYIEKILVEGLGVAVFIIGSDFLRLQAAG